MIQHFLRWDRFSAWACVGLGLAVPAIASAKEAVLIGAEIESFQNRAELVLRGGLVRPVRSSDYLGKGDIIQTDNDSQVDLRFNDDSFVRVGERSTFGFIPDTRRFRLSSGTALLLLPPNGNSSTVETPNITVNTQSAAVIVRHFPPLTAAASEVPDPAVELTNDAGRTAVMVLTNTEEPVEIVLQSGRRRELSAGQVAILDDLNLYLFEFDLALFYQTSPLLEDLFLDDPTYQEDLSATASLRQETAEDIDNQQDFEGDYLLNPSFLSPDTDVPSEGGWLFFVNPPSSESQSASEAAAAAAEPSTDDSTLSPLHSTSGGQLELSPPKTDAPSDTEPPTLDGETNQLPAGVVVPPASEMSPSP